VWAAAASALPVDFDWSGRDLLFRLAEPEFSGKKPPLANSAGRPVTAALSPGLVVLRTSLTAEMARRDYALRARGTPPTEYTLEVNGIPLSLEPVEGPDGFYFLVPAIYLHEGENTFVFRAAGKTALAFEETEAFALKFTDEDVHFARVFGLPPRTLVQPPTHSEQLKYDAIHYELAITLDMSSAYIDASLTATVESLDSTLAQIVLDLNDNSGNMIVSAVDQGPSTAPLPFTLNGSENRLTPLRFASSTTVPPRRAPSSETPTAAPPTTAPPSSTPSANLMAHATGGRARMFPTTRRPWNSTSPAPPPTPPSPTGLS